MSRAGDGGQRSGIPLADLLEGYSNVANIPYVVIHGLQQSSDKIEAGDLFFALSGIKTHGLRYLSQAAARGCAAAVYDPIELPEGFEIPAVEVPVCEVRGLSHVLGYIADRFFGCPSKFMNMLAVTGTNGKSSCSHFLADALSSHGKSGFIGTLGWGSRDKVRSTTHTTPDSIEIHRILAEFHQADYRFVAVEVSSHGLDQERLNGVRFRGALFTNFSRDHLDYHQTMEAYLEAKLRLLDWLGLEFVVYNADDYIAIPILERKRKGLRYLGYGSSESLVPDNAALVKYASIQHHTRGTRFTVHYGGKAAIIDVPVFGDFNVENLTATLAVLLELGYPFESATKDLCNACPVPGRMETIHHGGRSAVIDYAHTPDAMRSVLTSLRRHCDGELWIVFGCGGDRDRGKRAAMGSVADNLADHLVITDDNPRTEDPDRIIDDILKGITHRDAIVLRDRGIAIRHALRSAKPGDLVLVAGKGHETTQEIQGVKHPFNDRDVVKGILWELQPL
jgi:UDP-N-acetylmuramoyl-L-alanyl-D-glutamate--2,6-diaminopimelate ligase